jgi:hypothetical protein
MLLFDKKTSIKSFITDFAAVVATKLGSSLVIAKAIICIEVSSLMMYWFINAFKTPFKTD